MSHPGYTLIEATETTALYTHNGQTYRVTETEDGELLLEFPDHTTRMVSDELDEPTPGFDDWVEHALYN